MWGVSWPVGCQVHKLSFSNNHNEISRSSSYDVTASDKNTQCGESSSNRKGTSATPLWKTKLSKIKCLVSSFYVSYREPNTENTNTLILWNLQCALASMCGSLECEQMCRYCSKNFGSYSNPYSKIFYALLPIFCWKWILVSSYLPIQPSICYHGTAPLLLDRSCWNFIIVVFTKFCGDIKILVEIRQL